jgi:hypothetical protein
VCWPLVPKFVGSNLAEAVRFFRAKKILSMPSFGGEVKLSVPWCRFMACKRSLNATWKSGISGKIHRPFLAHIVPPLATRVSRWRLVVKVGTSGKVYIYSSTSDCEDLSRRLVVRVGTSKGSTISQHGCSTSGALSTRALQKERKKERTAE